MPMAESSDMSLTASSDTMFDLATMPAAVRAELTPLFDDLRRFMDRRIAEVSAEVHGAVQLVDFSETNLTGQLNTLREQISRVLSVPSAATHNSGLELEAIVQATEGAANKIMEAAEAISDLVRNIEGDPATLAKVAAGIEAIFEACSFQDITGQRIRRAIQHLQHVESVLADMALPGGAPLVAPPTPTSSGEGPDLWQDSVDALFDAPKVEMAQDDIDSMF